MSWDSDWPTPEPRIGSLFSGYGGLDMGVQALIGGEVAWHVEYDAAPSKILAHHWPDVPNYGDISTVDWSAVEPVDVLTGGFPCQDLSLAGRRAGMRTGTRSGLWANYLKAIDVLRPSLVVIENVRGLLSGCAESSLEPCPGCVGNGEHRPVLRALGRVLGDLADLGYDAEWVGVRAADAGAPHGRYRVFVLAHPTSTRRRAREDGRASGGDAGPRAWGLEPQRSGGQRSGTVAHASGSRSGGRATRPESPWRDHATVGSGPRGTGAWPAPEDSNVTAGSQRRLTASGQAAVGWSWPDSGRRGGTSIADTSGSRRRSIGRFESLERDVNGRGGEDLAWGAYQPAIRRWEHATGRYAPAPTVPDGRDRGQRLNAVFVEWMMGLPAGHVTHPAIGLTRNEQLKALGNGVVPQQAALALSKLLNRERVAA